MTMEAWPKSLTRSGALKAWWPCSPSPTVEREDERKRASHTLQASQLNPANVFLGCLHRIRCKEELPKLEELGASLDVFGDKQTHQAAHQGMCDW